MLVYGYNTKDMLGSAYMQDMIQKPTAQINSPQLAPDFGLMSGLQCIVDKARYFYQPHNYFPSLYHLLKLV